MGYCRAHKAVRTCQGLRHYLKHTTELGELAIDLIAQLVNMKASSRPTAAQVAAVNALLAHMLV